MSATLATGGRILAPLSRDATSLAHENGVITWVGQDAPATTLYPETCHVDLAGDWVAPAFVELRSAGLNPNDAGARGVVLARSLPGAVPVALVAELLRAGERVVVDLVSEPGALPVLARHLDAHAARVGGPAVARSTPTVLGVPDPGDELLARLARVGVVAVLLPLVEELTGRDLVRLAASGLVIAASVRDGDHLDPWGALRALTAVTGGRGLSPRAAFTAVTRGAWRAAGARDAVTGTLVPGAPATFARWRTGDLVAVAADDAVQRWSTDPRSGVPPMPDLGGPDPECIGLVVDGAEQAAHT